MLIPNSGTDLFGMVGDRVRLCAESLAEFSFPLHQETPDWSGDPKIFLNLPSVRFQETQQGKCITRDQNREFFS